VKKQRKILWGLTGGLGLGAFLLSGCGTATAAANHPAAKSKPVTTTASVAEATGSNETPWNTFPGVHVTWAVPITTTTWQPPHGTVRYEPPTGDTWLILRASLTNTTGHAVTLSSTAFAVLANHTVYAPVNALTAQAGAPWVTGPNATTPPVCAIPAHGTETATVIFVVPTEAVTHPSNTAILFDDTQTALPTPAKA